MPSGPLLGIVALKTGFESRGHQTQLQQKGKGFMSTTAERERIVPVKSTAPWTIEADHPRNCDLMVLGIQNVRLRSAIKPIKIVQTTEHGETVNRPMPADVVPGLPIDIPGMRLSVNPATGEWRVYDPLEQDEKTLEQIKLAIERSSGTRVATKLRGVPEKKGRLTPDGMKTLAREMFNLVSSGEAKVTSGVAPTQEEVDAMPGDYLSNPTGTTHWSQPRYEKDIPEWEQTLNRLR
jgi:hypothetical protein